MRRVLAYAGVVLGTPVLALAGYALFLVATVPPLRSLADYHPYVVTRVLDRHGEVIARFFKERRTLVPRDKMPERLVKAFLAAEDAGFYDHGGVDLSGVLAAVVQEVRHKVLGSPRRGGSTITQQLAKTLFLSTEQTYGRKLREMWLARGMEQALTKDEILYLYLNQIYFGNGAYGVEEAAQTYFGKHAWDLSLAECATLASIPKHPNVINPIYNPNRTLERRAYVLNQLEKRGFASAAEVAEALATPLTRDRPPLEFLNRSPWVAEDVKQQVLRLHGEEAVFHHGLEVHVAVDARSDVAAQRALAAGLEAADKRMGYRGPLLELRGNDLRAFLVAAHTSLEDRLPADAGLRADRVWDLRDVGPGQDAEEAGAAVRWAYRDVSAVVAGVVILVDDAAEVAQVDLGTVTGTLAMADMKWARFLKGSERGPVPRKPSDVVTVGDVVWVRILREVPAARPVAGTAQATVPVLGLEQEPRVQGALVAVEPETHRVRAMAGGWSFGRSNYNRATLARRQPGSAFKPFIYAAALESRTYTPSTLVVDAPKVFFETGSRRPWKPQNSDGKHRGDIRLRECLTHSVNTCSVTLVEDLTPGKVVEMAQRVGLGADWPLSLTLALGTGSVTPLGLANAYATLADEGHHAPPTLVDRVVSADGRVLWEAPLDRQPVMDPEVAYLTLSLMKSVVETGTAWRIRELGRPVAGKTGTTNEARDAWFAGCLPGMCAAVWVGMDDNSPMGPEEFGGRAAAPIWLDFFKTILTDAPARDFPVPPGVETRVVDPRTGLLAGPNQPDGIVEYFLTGTVPNIMASEAAAGRPDEWLGQ